jgi:hypothetical protein
MLKRFIIGMLLLLMMALIGGIYFKGYLLEEVDLNKTIMSIFDKVEEDEYTDSNLKSFKPTEVKGILKESLRTPEMVSEAKILYGNTLLTIPLPTKEVMNSFSDTLFAVDGSFYIVASKNYSSVDKEDKRTIEVHNLGFNEPKVIELILPDRGIAVYIQYYTAEALSFFTSSHLNKMTDVLVKMDFTLSNDELASLVTIDTNLIPKKEDMFIEDVYLDIVNNNKSSFEGYSDFITQEGKIFNYYRAIGFLDSRIKVEFARLTEMGYTPLEVGNYKGISYVKFRELTLLGYPLTTNSSLIYRIAN